MLSSYLLQKSHKLPNSSCLKITPSLIADAFLTFSESRHLKLYGVLSHLSYLSCDEGKETSSQSPAFSQCLHD